MQLLQYNNLFSAGSPTKLKHNLDINVFALLPGAGKHQKKGSPVKNYIPQPFQRSTSLDLEKHNLDDNPQVAISTPTQNERNIDDVEVLHSVTKVRYYLIYVYYILHAFIVFHFF